MTIIQLERFADPALYRAAVGDWLLANPVACNHIFTTLHDLTPQQARRRSAWMARLHCAGATCGVALIGMAPPLRPVMVSLLNDEAAAAVAEALTKDGIAVDGLIGTVDSAQLLARHLGVRTSERFRLGNHVLDVAPMAPPCAGRMRAATPDDFGVILDWETAFAAECGLPDKREALALEVAERLASPVQLQWLWEVAGQAVAMALGRPCPPLARIGMVYTLPARRGNGYAGALVASLSASLQARGCASVYLATDLANPASNRLYRRIGYRCLGELTHLDVVPEG
jgi:ribosomal protein S18 acetylase RimI-like enzyme